MQQQRERERVRVRDREAVRERDTATKNIVTNKDGNTDPEKAERHTHLARSDPLALEKQPRLQRGGRKAEQRQRCDCQPSHTHTDSAGPLRAGDGRVAAAAAPQPSHGSMLAHALAHRHEPAPRAGEERWTRATAFLAGKLGALSADKVLVARLIILRSRPLVRVLRLSGRCSRACASL